MPNRVITFTIYHPGTDTPWEGAVITASLLRSFSVGATLYPADRVVSGATGADGKGSLTLAVPSTGTADWQFRLPDGRLPRVAIADGPDTDLTTLIASAAANVPPTALQQAIDAEAAARASVDADLQAQINSGTGAVASVNGQTGTVTLNAASVGADASGTAAGLVASEATARAAADTTNANAISAEAAARVSADTTLQTNITSEASIRAAADTAEASARASADTTNANAISTHAARTDNPHVTTAAQVGAYTTTQADTLLVAKAQALTPTTVKTTNYTAAANELVICDTSGGGFTVTFPIAPADKTLIAVKLITAGNTLTVALGGSDVFNRSGGSTSGSLTQANQAILCQYKASGAIWYVLADDLPLSVLDARYQPIDADLTAIAALTTTSYGRSLLTAADAAGAQSLLNLGSLATQSSVTASQISDASANGRSMLTAANYAAMKTLLSLNNVENTALSTWAGSTNITTLGTVASGTWQGGVIAPAYGGTGTANSGALAWPSGGGTVALLATANTFSAEQTIAQAVTGTPASGVVPQLKISNPSNANSRLQLYYDTTNNVGYIDAVTWGTATRALILNGSGGDVGIGSTSTPASGTVHIRKNLRVETSGASVTIINQTPTNYSFGQHVILDTFTIGPSSDGSGANSLSINTSGRIQAGGSTFTAKFSVTNNANIPALLVTGHTTQTTSTALAQLTRNDTAAGVSQLLLLTGLGSGANGDGAALSFAQKSSTTAARTTADFQALWATATDASRKARIVGTVYDTAAREWIRGEASGTAPMIGFLGANALARQTVAADATDLASAITLVNDIKAKLGQSAGFGLFAN